MRAIVLIALKDLRQRVRDRSAILVGIVAPLGLAFIFSVIMPDFSGGDLDVQLGVVDADGGEAAHLLVDGVLAAVEAEGLVTTTDYPDAAAARAAVEAGDADAAIVIPAGFSAAVTAPTAPDCAGAAPCAVASVEVIGHADRQTAALVTKSIAESYAGRLTTSRVAVVTAMATGASDATAVAEAAATAPEEVGVADITAQSKQLDSTTYFAAAMGVFFLFFTVQFGVSSLLEERVNGTMPRLLAAPLRWWHVVAGKGVTSFVLGVVAMTVLVIGSSLLMGATWGNPAGVALLIVTGVLSAIGIMAVVASLARTAEQAANWQSIVAVTLGMLGGTFFPVSQGPAFLAQLSLLTPHAWFLRGLGELTGGASAAAALPAALAMVAFFAVTLGIAALRMRRMVAP